jgi:hypothetical protein
MPSDDPAQPSARLEAAADRLRIDAATAEALGAFRAAGVEALVLKGPSLTGWLYTTDDPNAYVDSIYGLATAGPVNSDVGSAPLAHADAQASTTGGTLAGEGSKADVRSDPADPEPSQTLLLDLLPTAPLRRRQA